eukprot:TRINITY_DN55827_c0_g1_i1.p1 TRINITY_DN55827_c0_g1~~TRINITY_DN55827_c0_g1_i1.p1  ORF type:complete len:101 (+),score=4.00 TRINITY_DN55827_c0_g1_i1:82-384(+)
MKKQQCQSKQGATEVAMWLEKLHLQLHFLLVDASKGQADNTNNRCEQNGFPATSKTATAICHRSYSTVHNIIRQHRTAAQISCALRAARQKINSLCAEAP